MNFGILTYTLWWSRSRYFLMASCNAGDCGLSITLPIIRKKIEWVCKFCTRCKGVYKTMITFGWCDVIKVFIDPTILSSLYHFPKLRFVKDKDAKCICIQCIILNNVSNVLSLYWVLHYITYWCTEPSGFSHVNYNT